MSPLRRFAPFMCVLVGASGCGRDEPLPPSETGRYLVELTAPPSLSAAEGIMAQAGGGMTEQKAALQAALPGLSVVRPLDELPMLVVTVADRATYDALEASPLVAHVWPDARYELNDVESFGWVSQPATVAAGVTGKGATVAVLDTGLDYRKAAFGTCSAPGVAGCSVAWVQDFAADDGALDANGHGTNVAGIVVGMAPGARVVGLDVFTGDGAYTSDIISAISWVVANRAKYTIVALNLSLGGGFSASPCATDVFATPIATARAAGVLSVVAAGNSARTTGLSSPACVPSALSVGAVYDTSLGGLAYGVCADAATAPGQVACFSNSAPFLSLFAPGVQVTAAGITMSGTSQATPHVAGALALLASKYPSDTASLRASRLLSGAPTVRDPRNGVVRPRLQLGANAGACAISVTPQSATVAVGGGPVTFTVTPTAPTCSWTITGAPSWLLPSVTAGVGPGSFKMTVPSNPGAVRAGVFQVSGVQIALTQEADLTPPTGTLVVPALTGTTAVTATMTATDPSGVNGVCVSTSSTCTAWRAWATTVPVTLPAGDGVKTVWAWFRDGRNNVSSTPVKATTTLDTTAPTNGLVSAVSSPGAIRLSWLDFSDATSGVAKYRVVQSTTTADPVAGCTGATVYEGTAATVSLAVPAKTTRRYRVCAVDAAKNVSTGALARATTP